VWVGAAYIPAVLLVFVHGGPVAWNGLFSWWLGAFAFFVWILIMTPLLLRAIKQLEAAPRSREVLEGSREIGTQSA
jgi:hypothetical protein